MSLTPQQLRAVMANGSVAVIAGAGTGKTHMLTERYLHHLRVDSLGPLQLVAATFTEAAAAELRGRVRARLREIPELANVMAELEAGQIGTLHSLAGRICREHPDAAGVPWDFRVQDEVQQRLWSERHLRQAVADLPPAMTEELPYGTLVATLRALLADPFTARAALAADPREWPELIEAEKARVYERLSSLPAWSRALAVLEGANGPEGDKLELQRRAALEAVACFDAGDFNAASCSTLDGLSRRPGSAKAWGDGIDEVKEACGHLKECYRSGKYAFELTLGAADERLQRSLVPLAEAFHRVEEQIAQAKRRERLLDFNDLEIHALRALGSAEVRRFYRHRWRAFLVDEFQDTNPVQAQLLALLTGLRLGVDHDFGLAGAESQRLHDEGGLPPAKLTVVGDEKQSIYGFRRADLTVFRAVRQAIAAAGGEIVELSTSFRTHQRLIEPLNQVFEPALAALHQALEGARTETPGDAPFLEVRLVVSEEKVLKQFRQRAEAHHLGELIEALLGAGTPVHDKASARLRPVRPGDIAILARTWESLGPYGDELAARGIPTIHAGGGNLLAQREVKDALALLRFLADPSDDLSLAAMLRSPFFAVADRRLVELSAEARAGGSSWWQALAQHASGRSKTSDPFSLGQRAASDEGSRPGSLSAAATTLERLMEQRRHPPSTLLALADDLTGYTAVIANLPGGQRRLADWRGFRDFVTELEAGSEDVFTVVRELRQLGALEGVKVARPGMEAGDAVSLMSVHNAKGLEWPIVIVPDITGGRSNHGVPAPFEAGTGVAFKVEDDTGEQAEPALYKILDERRKQREADEELRVIYVALTRARDRVILSGNEEKGGRLQVLEAGLEAAGVEVLRIPFEAADSVPKAPLLEVASAVGEPLLDRIGEGLFELPVTSLATYATCPKRFHFEQVLQHPGTNPVGGEFESPDDDEERQAGNGVAARIGTLTHRALQSDIDGVADLARHDPTLAPELVERALAFARTFRRSNDYAHVRERITRREAPFVVAASEYGSRIRLRGVADALGPDFVLDYKTGSREESHLLQVAVYARAFGVEQGYVAYLQEAKLRTFAGDELATGRERAKEVLQAIEMGDFEPSPEVEKCRICAFESICESSSLRNKTPKEVPHEARAT